MTYRIRALELRFFGSNFGLSARRLWEHTELGQINVFRQSVSERNELNVATEFIDLVRFERTTFVLTGLTLVEFLAGDYRSISGFDGGDDLVRLVKSEGAVTFIHGVSVHLDRCANRRALRNQHHQFLPSALADDCFGVPHIFSALKKRLDSMGKQKANGDQWVKTIDNFRQSGMRAEEFECAELIPDLSPGEGNEEQYTASRLAGLCNFKNLRLSVIPVVRDAEHQLRFSKVPERALKRTKRLPKAQVGQSRDVAEFDPVLGYRIEEVNHQTLWGAESHWQAVMHDGTVIEDDRGQSYFTTKPEALALAASHARNRFPKRTALGRFGRFAWTGGETYREWLITLPYFHHSYLSGHFNVRNVLAHIRCEVRQGADDERVLMLQEVQSDWAQRARRAVSTGEADEDDEVPPPFMKEWPALTMKLVLLHAAYSELDAVAWTRGVHQVDRYSGLGATGLKELYDRTLPREVNRMLKSIGVACELIGVFVPTNFKVTQSERGYEVYSPENELLGVAASMEDAREFVPDLGHEVLRDVHGVRLTDSNRKAILAAGFPAWG